MWYKRRIMVPTTEFERDAVRHVQLVLGGTVTGDMDEDTKSRIRGMQLLFGLPNTGIIDDATAKQIDRIFPEGA